MGKAGGRGAWHMHLFDVASLPQSAGRGPKMMILRLVGRETAP